MVTSSVCLALFSLVKSAAHDLADAFRGVLGVSYLADDLGDSYAAFTILSAKLCSTSPSLIVQESNLSVSCVQKSLSTTFDSKA